MTFTPDHVLKRTTSIVLALYVGAFLGQALCALHVTDAESQMASGPNGFAPHAMSSMATFGSPPAVVHTSSSRAVHTPSQPGEYPDKRGSEHSGACAVVACASAVTAATDHALVLTQAVSSVQVAYLGETLPPDAEMLLPPPRLG